MYEWMFTHEDTMAYQSREVTTGNLTRPVWQMSFECMTEYDWYVICTMMETGRRNKMETPLLKQKGGIGLKSDARFYSLEHQDTTSLLEHRMNVNPSCQSQFDKASVQMVQNKWMDRSWSARNVRMQDLNRRHLRNISSKSWCKRKCHRDLGDVEVHS